MPSKGELDILTNTLNELSDFKEKYSIRPVSKKQPQFIIKNVPNEIKAEELFESLSKRYVGINERTASLTHSFKVKKMDLII